jgi:hypothetical protein
MSYVKGALTVERFYILYKGSRRTSKTHISVFIRIKRSNKNEFKFWVDFSILAICHQFLWQHDHRTCVCKDVCMNVSIRTYVGCRMELGELCKLSNTFVRWSAEGRFYDTEWRYGMVMSVCLSVCLGVLFFLRDESSDVNRHHWKQSRTTKEA